MDSIAYLKDPLDATKMTNVVKAHARYTVQSAKALIEGQVPKYDKYDRTNDKAARTFLLASLQIDLSNKVAEKLDDDDPFPIVWLQFLKAIHGLQDQLTECVEECRNRFHKPGIGLVRGKAKGIILDLEGPCVAHDRPAGEDGIQ